MVESPCLIACGKLTFNYALVFMAKGSDVKSTGGSGALVWTAPVDGRFDGLALWSDSIR